MQYVDLTGYKATTLNFGSKQLPQSGALKYEYNPLQVYRVQDEAEKLKVPKYSIVGLDSSKLEFDLNYPVDIVTQPSYDGSVNLILNDGKHQPRLINTRFSTTGMNTYKIVDREGDNDTNIYDEETFTSEISLYKKVNSIVKLHFSGLGQSGNLKVGNYIFYFKLADSDGNETDFVAESGIVTCHIGNLNDPFSIRGGFEDENSYKRVFFQISNIDTSYDKVIVYYTRSTSSQDGNEITLAYKILSTFPIYNKEAQIDITGFEPTSSASLDEINLLYNVVDNAKSQTTCQNMLFLGNINKPSIDYKELSDISLRIVPNLTQDVNIGNVSHEYKDPTGKYEYYNVNNIYNYLGYWNNELYRFGVVYILDNYELSPVFNVLGCDVISGDSVSNGTDVNYIPLYHEREGGTKERIYINIDKENYNIVYSKGGETVERNNLNSKGVVRFKSSTPQITKDGVKPIGVKFRVHEDVLKELKKLGVKGYFFVRQKRIKTIFCQAIPIGLDSCSYLPVLPGHDGKHIGERFIDDNRMLTHEFLSRKFQNSTFEDKILKSKAALCPEFDVNPQYYNQFFTAAQFICNPYLEVGKFNNSNVHFYLDPNKIKSNNLPEDALYTITSVPDDTQYIKGRSQVFSARAGEASDASKFSYFGYKNKITKATNIVRGIFGPYIGLEGNVDLEGYLVDIMIPNYSVNNMQDYFKIRYRDASPFFAVSDRIQLVDDSETITHDVYRGDCYIGNFTHRMIRNFQDSDAPTNDEIVSTDTWKDHYEIGGNNSAVERSKINRGDVNAVKIGHWATMKVCSSLNLSMRCTNPFYPTETGLTGQVRGFFPLQAMSVSGASKIPESFLHNKGFAKTIGDRSYYDMPDVPAIKSIFKTRIMYSDININDAFKNGFRTFRGTNYFDYPMTYGSIVKMLEWSGNIVCVFEHGIAVIPVNERAVATNAAGGNVFITANKVIPENPNIISGSYGSQWADSIIKTPDAVYGVDTVAKKIWKLHVAGTLSPQFKLEILSDFKLQKFLNDNISLTEHELLPIIGVRNVKTHYNAFKNDVMFTFYDDINTLEEKVWNLCYNEVLDKFVTFYSWVPSFSENIDNIFFTFDRNTSKAIAKLHNDVGLIRFRFVNTYKTFSNIGDFSSIGKDEPVGTLSLEDITIDKVNDKESVNLFKEAEVQYEITDDTLLGIFRIEENRLMWNSNKLWDGDVGGIVYNIPIRATIKQSQVDSTDQQIGEYNHIIDSTITIADSKYLNNTDNTYFWKHGQAGLMKTQGRIKPCLWYDKQHPFEIEFIVSENQTVHKIFTDLQIIANKAEPESLHFEISGEVYNFADDKKNIFFRQEAIKHLYQYNGSDIAYDKEYLNVLPEQRKSQFSRYFDKSTIFPMYYSRVDTLNEIEDFYQSKSEMGKDYQRMSGTEVKYNPTMNQFNLVTHIKGCPIGGQYLQEISIDRYYQLINSGYKHMVETKEIKEKTHYYEKSVYNRLNGNMWYREDKWYVQIPSIVYYQKNEEEWPNGNPILNLANTPVPQDLQFSGITEVSIPKELDNKGYGSDNFEFINWSERKETRIRDKYARIKIRYSGKDLVVLYAILTLYTQSYV